MKRLASQPYRLNTSVSHHGASLPVYIYSSPATHRVNRPRPRQSLPCSTSSSASCAQTVPLNPLPYLHPRTVIARKTSPSIPPLTPCLPSCTPAPSPHTSPRPLPAVATSLPRVRFKCPTRSPLPRRKSSATRAARGCGKALTGPRGPGRSEGRG